MNNLKFLLNAEDAKEKVETFIKEKKLNVTQAESDKILSDLNQNEVKTLLDIVVQILEAKGIVKTFESDSKLNAEGNKISPTTTIRVSY